MEIKAMEKVARAPKVVIGKASCIAKGAPPLHHSSKSPHHASCDDGDCVITDTKLDVNTGNSKMVTLKSGNYSGTINTTVNGRTCRVWNTVTANDSSNWELYVSRHGEHNYCRGSGGYGSYYFCFTTDPNKLYEKCEIPRCLKLSKGERLYPLSIF